MEKLKNKKKDNLHIRWLRNYFYRDINEAIEGLVEDAARKYLDLMCPEAWSLDERDKILWADDIPDYWEVKKMLDKVSPDKNKYPNTLTDLEEKLRKLIVEHFPELDSTRN